MLRRAILAVFLGAVAVLVGVSSARGADAFYIVTGFGDSGGSCAPYANAPGAFTCTTLRAAVAAADADADSDSIYLQPGTYTLGSAINLATDVALFGGNARTTVLQRSGVGRLVSIEAGVNATIYGLTLTSGHSLTGEGGAILNAGTLLLWEARVTGNQAPGGGGIANDQTGDLQVLWSLIDHNDAVGVDGPTGPGGGILNHGTLSMQDSTVALNSGASAAGITSDAQQLATLTHVTVAGNDTASSNPAGVSFAGPWTANGSLFTGNTGDSPQDNCGTPTSGGSGNIADDSTCGFGTGNNADDLPGPSLQLVDRGGMTDVVDVAGTPAKDFEATCTTPYDQRLGQRQVNAPCDAGAYEEGVPAGPITPLFPIPTPTASPITGPTPTATATPSPTPSPTPTPVPRKSVVVTTVKGTVKFRLPGTNRFVELDGTQGIPVGATVDTKRGTVQLTSLQKAGGKLQTAKFFDGIFKLGQTKTTTNLTLTEKLAACPKRGKKASAAAKKKKPKSRRLWGDGSGAFRTAGRYSAATVRGTKWLVQDSCSGTLTRVTQGAVNVRDNVRRKTIVVRAGHRYLAKPRR